jgi:sodium/bile acid cotransporter 7
MEATEEEAASPATGAPWWRQVRPDWFLIGMVVAVALAWLFPGPGAKGGWMHPELVTNLGVSLIFFLHGLALPFAALRAGTLQWRLHLVVQACTYLLFPAMAILLLKATGATMTPGLRLGFFFLGALPSTVSSSVAMTAAARGNVAAAVFNATLSSLIGVVVTPAWLAWYAGARNGESLPLTHVILDLVKWLVLPLVIGQLLRPWLGAWASRNKRLINTVDRGTILLLVYTSFCESMAQGVWTGQGDSSLGITLAGSAILLAAALVLTSAACRALGFSREDRIAAVFCGSKKTLASGVPMAQLIFGRSPELGLILLPIMVYHPLQLVVCGILAGRWARRAVD